MEGAEATPKGRRLYWNKPLWVFTVTNFLESSSIVEFVGNCVKLSFEKMVPAASDTTLGILSVFFSLIYGKLIFAADPSCLTDVAHSEN